MNDRTEDRAEDRMEDRTVSTETQHGCPRGDDPSRPDGRTAMTGGQTGGQTGDPTGGGSGGAARVEEVWTYAGRRESDGKRYFAWQDGDGQERYYAKVRGLTIGGRYILTVTRDGDRVSVVPEPRYTGERIDEGTRREMEALDIAASAALAAQARDRNDARRKALDDAVQPLVEIAARLRFGHERNALLAYVIHRLTQGR